MVFRRSFLILPMLVAIALLVLGARGYVPAQPANHTVQGMGQVRNTSMLHLQWYANGSDWEYVTRQPIGPETKNDPVQGVLVHFTENNAGYETTTTPWIAFVTCDATATNSSSKVDVFSMARYRGAKSLILYSLYSETCEVSPGYGHSDLEVFTAQSLNASRHIEYTFGQFGPSSGSYYGSFNATLLNAAAGVVDDAFALGYPMAPGFLFATLLANNTNSAGIIGGGSQNDVNATGTSTSSTGNSSQDTGVAMIVLYVITGCVSALFCAVIVSGAIKAIRYPERYGPRSADPTLGGGQSRASGLGRAILDTFPIVKFRSSGTDQEPDPPRHKDIESIPLAIEPSDPVPPDSMRLAQLSPTVEHDPHGLDPREGMASSETGRETRDDSPVSEGMDRTGPPSQTNAEVHGESCLSASPCDIDAPMPECIGRETCPICIVGFEEGDDLRVLPCEGKHRFHLSCVDPWLLELSASCPICRQDFRALETIISGESVEAAPTNRNSEASTPTTQLNRFSRYLRFARRLQQSGDQEPPPPEV